MVQGLESTGKRRAIANYLAYHEKVRIAHGKLWKGKGLRKCLLKESKVFHAACWVSYSRFSFLTHLLRNISKMYDKGV